MYQGLTLVLVSQTILTNEWGIPLEILGGLRDFGHLRGFDVIRLVYITILQAIGQNMGFVQYCAYRCIQNVEIIQKMFMSILVDISRY